MKTVIEEHITSSDHLAKKHVHPKMLSLLEMGGFNSVYQSAKGAHLVDESGNEYLDLLSGGGVYLVGRNNKRIHEALADVLGMDIPNLTIVNAPVLSGLLAEKLLELVGPHYTKCLFSNTGSEASDLAIRFARFATGRRRMLYLEGAFHGRTYADVSICGSPELRKGMEPLMPVCTPLRPNDIDQLERELSKGDVAGFFFEPVQGMTGIVLEEEYLKAAERLCNEYGALLCADEVQTGLCRTGPWFASLDKGVRPHMVWVSKILSGGTVPVSALFLTEELYNKIYAGFTSGPVYFSTFAENNLAMAAGIANIELLKEMNAPRRATELGLVIREGIEAIAEKYDVIDRVEGQGLLQVVYFRNSAKLGLKLQQTLMRAADPAAFGAAVNVDLYRDKRIIVQVPGATLNAIKILPPVILSDEDVEYFLESFEDVIASYYEERAPIASVTKGFVKSALKKLESRVPAGFLPPVLTGAVGAEKKNSEPLKKHHPEIRRATDYDRDISEHCDFLVIGSGPGGAVAARQLAKTGKSVIMVDAGEVADPSEFNDDVFDTFNKHFWDSGLRTTRGNVILPTLTTRVLGGGAVFNCQICLRMPDYQVKRWNREHGVEMTSEEMERHYDEVEKVFRVEPTPPEIQGRRNALFKIGADAMGIHSEPIRRAVTGCKGSARCIVGCPNGAKNSPDFAIVPEFIENGGRVLTSVHIQKLIMRGDRCAGAIGWTTDPETGKRVHKVRITAKCTVIAAGCVSTPTILQRSRIKNRLIGQNFRTHPGIYTLGEYDEPVNPWMGATQGYHSTEFLEDKGIKLETLWVNAPLIAAKFPGIGTRYKEHLGNYRNMSVFDGWVSGDDSVGAVRALPGGGKDITYNLGQGDARRMKEATALTAELLFHSGAHTVYTGMNGQFATLYDLDDVQTLREEKLGPSDFTTGSQHLFGTTPMGADRDRHVCDSHGAVYGVENLYVADTGLMPISPGGNPMLPLMAIANRIGETVGERY